MNIYRIKKLLDQLIQKYSLDLQDLVVFTEAASGYYLYNPLLAALAGAKKVFCYTEDSMYGLKEEIKQQTLQQAKLWQVADKLEVLFEKTSTAIANSDIVTNSGFVRPIDDAMISQMKSTAVIPLMWETWEFRKNELNLATCRDADILVLGTNESQPPCDLRKIAGLLAQKLLFELDLEGYDCKILLLGGQPSLGESIYHYFVQQNVSLTWFGDNDHPQCRPYDTLSNHFEAVGATYDAIIIAEHKNNLLLLGESGLLSYTQLQRLNPGICLGVISGNLDSDGLKASGITYYPKQIQPFGYMSYQAFSLGPRPVVELFCAGLKVGEVMARARLQGCNIEQTVNYALQHAPAMDFQGDQSWLPKPLKI